MEKKLGVNEVSTQLSGQKTPIREMVFLAEQAADSGIRALPGQQWTLHHSIDETSRLEKLQGLLDGRYKAEEVESAVKPDAIIYDVKDIEKEGLEKVSGRIRDLSSIIKYYDYPRFVKFLESMRGENLPLENIVNLYQEIIQTRIQKKVMDSYGYTGKKQMEVALQVEADEIVQNINNYSRSQKVLKALKSDWLCDDMGLVPMEKRDQIISGLSGDERQLFEDMRSAYREYVQSGSESGYQRINETIQKSFEKIHQPPKKDETSQSMQKLDEEIEKYKDKSVPPGDRRDTNILPEDSDEYNTPPPRESIDSKEGNQNNHLYEISPALGGYYTEGRKSYYDIKTKTWSKKKQLSEYKTSIEGEKTATISGRVNSGIKSIPIPVSHALDMSSLKVSSGEVEIWRDQNGCFYIKADKETSFSIDFKKEIKPLVNPPIAEDTALLYKGSLSAKTEAVIFRLNGDSITMAEQIRQYILANHFYPGGGDLQKAGALQYKLRNESNSDNYLQNIDSSEYLECYSANTLFVAMLRKAGIAARLVKGHRVEGGINGKSFITQQTGHVWAEIWDGKGWRRFDATPNPKPEDQKKNNNEPQNEAAPEANDGGVDRPQEQKNQTEKNTSQKNNLLDQLSKTSDGDVNKLESQIREAKKQIEKIDQKKQELEEKIQNLKKFKDLEQLKEEVEESELFDDLKKDVQNKIEAKESQIKDELKEEIEKMMDDGFMDKKEGEKRLKEIEEKENTELDEVQKEISGENELYSQYEAIRQEVLPLVEDWVKYFANRLPKQSEVEIDRDYLTRQGVFDRRAVMKARNLVFGTIKNPKEFKPSIKPKFMSSILLDVSGSMGGEKIKSSQKLLIFYSELFSRISKEFGYIRFSIDTFSDSVTEIKGFEQDYDSSAIYDYGDGKPSTVKVRLMKNVGIQGGTNMLEGIKKAAKALNRETLDYPDYVSAFYFIGDGGDTFGNAKNITQFLQTNDSERGFGGHMYSAILLGMESQRKELADIFGDEHTTVVPKFDELIEESMKKLDEDLTEYLKNKTI